MQYSSDAMVLASINGTSVIGTPEYAVIIFGVPCETEADAQTDVSV